MHFSQAGVDSFSDHQQLGEISDVVDQCINWARAEIVNRARNWYTAAALATSTTVNEWTTVLACYRLCQKRGNSIPESMLAEVEYIRGILKELQDGTYILAGIDPAYDGRPAVSNIEIVRGYVYRKSRVTPNSSDRGPLNPAIRQDKIEYPYPYE